MVGAQPPVYSPVQPASQAEDAAKRMGAVSADRPVPATESGTEPNPAASAKTGETTASEPKPADEQNSEQKPDTEKRFQELTPEEQRELQDLRQRDQEVRAHEQAHVAAGGRYVTKAASYDYETGPDGQRYAIGGEVSINVAPIAGDPQATIAKAQVVLRAALAPAEPSPQDQRVASEARLMEAQARSELLRQRQSEPPTMDESADADASGDTEPPDPQAGERLRQRFADFFAWPLSGGFSQYA
jgi:hypothetical protein